MLAKEKFGIRGRSLQDKNMTFIPFTAKTRMSGVDFDGNEIRKGAADAMQEYVTHNGLSLIHIWSLLYATTTTPVLGLWPSKTEIFFILIQNLYVILI